MRHLITTAALIALLAASARGALLPLGETSPGAGYLRVELYEAIPFAPLTVRHSFGPGTVWQGVPKVLDPAGRTVNETGMPGGDFTGRHTYVWVPADAPWLLLWSYGSGHGPNSHFRIDLAAETSPVQVWLGLGPAPGWTPGDFLLVRAPGRGEWTVARSVGIPEPAAGWLALLGLAPLVRRR